MRRFPINQGRDDISQRGQTKIDFCGFFESLSRGARFGLPLGSCQIHEVQFAHFDALIAVGTLFAAFDLHREDGVRSAKGGDQGLASHESNKS